MALNSFICVIGQMERNVFCQINWIKLSTQNTNRLVVKIETIPFATYAGNSSNTITICIRKWNANRTHFIYHNAPCRHYVQVGNAMSKILLNVLTFWRYSVSSAYANWNNDFRFNTRKCLKYACNSCMMFCALISVPLGILTTTSW